MSRHPFYTIIKNHSKLEKDYKTRDIKGHHLADWFGDAFVGWDEIDKSMEGY